MKSLLLSVFIFHILVHQVNSVSPSKEGTSESANEETTSRTIKQGKKESFSVILQHSLSYKNEFIPRCKLNYAYHGRIGQYSDDGVDFESLSVSSLQETFQTEFTGFKDLLQNGGYYRVKLQLPTGREVFSLAKPCAILESSFLDEIKLYLNQLGEIVGFSYVPENGSCSHTTEFYLHQLSELEQTKSKSLWKSTLSISFGVEAPKPIEVKREGTEDIPGTTKGDKPDEKVEQPGFLQRYWWVLLPMMVMMVINNMIGGGSEEPARQGAPGAPGGQGRGQPARRGR